MWDSYREIVQKYSKIPLEEERRLIARAKRGSRKSRDEMVLRHIGFVIFRLHRRVFPQYLKAHGPDLLAATFPVLYQKIKTYNLDYKDRHGKPKPVRFSSYIWKRVDGFIIDSIRKELQQTSENDPVTLSEIEPLAEARLPCGGRC